jgi:hypothetical protein
VYDKDEDEVMFSYEDQEDLDFILQLNGDEIDRWWESLAEDEQSRAAELIRISREHMEMIQLTNKRPRCHVMEPTTSVH